MNVLQNNPDYNPLKYPFLLEKGHIICVVGAGGKTSWIKNMASFCSENGMKTLVTTTTHQGMPDDGSFVESVEAAEKIWAIGRYVTIGKVFADKESEIPHIKLKMPDEIFLKEMISASDIVFMESDGSRHRPIKAPASFEPVIYDDCDIVVGVVGMHAIGHPVNDVGFRLPELLMLLNCDEDHIITEEDLEKVIKSDKGLRKAVDGRQFFPVKNRALSI